MEIEPLSFVGVHTHELYMDGNDDLFGGHLWYNGEQLNTWRHYIWCLRHTEILDTIIKPTEGFLNDYSFVRDNAGNMYWVERFTVSRFKKKTKGGIIITLAEGKFKDIRWMYASSKGELYFIDLVDLYKIDLNGKYHLLAKNLAQHTASFGWLGDDKHSLFGIWTDKNNNVYVANYSGQVVKRINAAGKVENAVYSTSPWSPTGGIFDDEGNLWLLEASITNEVRVRKIKKDALMKGNKFKAYTTNNILPVGIVAGIFSLFILFARKMVVRKRKEK
ncbi:MAG: hypothetical protein M3O67_02670 [Bacteroidota bacterium]|nr:hypothetical protein [Bacteroidota bacterium]